MMMFNASLQEEYIIYSIVQTNLMMKSPFLEHFGEIHFKMHGYNDANQFASY